MLRKYVRKTTKGSFTEECMKSAVDLVIIDGYSIRQTAEKSGLKFATLQRYVTKEKEKTEGETISMTPNYACRQIFTADQEDDLKNYLVECSAMCYGKSTRDLGEIAYEMATINNIEVPDSWHRDKKSGLEWMRLFIQRNRLRIRTPEGCSLSRMTAFNKHNVDLFFSNLEILYGREESFGYGTRVWNLDETGTTTVQLCGKIIAKKGVKQVNAATSQERGILVTTCVAVNAMGSFIPPVMVFPRKNYKPHMINGAPAGTLGLANPSGWMTSDIFPQVIRHFTKFTSASKENLCLLILDNHESHLSIEALDLAKANGITILTLPPHSSHRMQPLDVSVYGPFKTYYNQALQAWLLAHPGVPASIYDVASCVGMTFNKALVPTNIINGFRHSGIFPFDKTIFSEADFLCSSVTDREIPTNTNPEAGPSNAPQAGQSAAPDVGQSNVSEAEKSDASENKQTDASNPGTSVTTPSVSQNGEIERNIEPFSTVCTTGSQNKKFISPSVFRGYPKDKARKLNRKPREKGSSIIATSTPEKMKLQEKSEKRKAKKSKALTPRVLFPKKPKQNTIESDDEDVDMESLPSSPLNESLDSVDEFETVISSQFIKGKLDKPLKKDEYVLVEFSDQNKNKIKFYYVGQYTGATANDGAHGIKFLRRAFKLESTFFFPNIPDVADVPESDVKMILPAPTTIHGTKRIQSKIKFDIVFSGIDLR